MKPFKSKYGIFKDSNVILFPLKYKTIPLCAITEIKIIEKKTGLNNLFKFLKTNDYDFTIVLDNQKEVKFSFSKRNLNSVITFKNRILHMKFSLREKLN